MKILVIRRDNIGDLVCTTPLFRYLRLKYPDSWIGALVNSYNVPVLEGNPDIDEVFAYRKAKHRVSGEFRLRIWFDTFLLLLKLRRMSIDTVFIASPGGERYARLIAPREIVSGTVDGKCLHEVERCLGLIEAGDFHFAKHVSVLPNAVLVKSISDRFGLKADQFGRVAVHISARRPKQRWPVESFIQLINQLLNLRLVQHVLVFWAPGASHDPAHPGDDDKSHELMLSFCQDRRVNAIETESLPELIAGLSLCDSMICADGGAMHLAAGLGKPIVCLFGDSNSERWHPWGVPFELICPESKVVRDVPVRDVVSAYQRLMERSCT